MGYLNSINSELLWNLQTPKFNKCKLEMCCVIALG